MAEAGNANTAANANDDKTTTHTNVVHHHHASSSHHNSTHTNAGGLGTTQTTTTPTSEGNNNNNPRKVDEEYVLPISYGSCAYWLGKKADEYHSHEWTVFVRGQNNRDLRDAIESVTFQLHPSFAEPKRVLTEPPYEVTETGWGEFEIGIEIRFHPEVGEDKEKLTANQKLFPDADEIAKSGPQTTKKPLVVEHREELIFHKPRKTFWEKAIKKRKTIDEERNAYDECDEKTALWKQREGRDDRN